MAVERVHPPGGHERRHTPWYKDRVMLGLLATIACSAFLFYLYEHQSYRVDSQTRQLSQQAVQLADAQRVIGSEYVAQVEACRRLNILRVEDNVSHYADWKVFRVVLMEQQAGPQPPTAQERRFQDAFERPLSAGVAVKSWTPRTNCGQAVNLRGSHFRPPSPIPFNQQLPPPSALQFYPVDFQ